MNELWSIALILKSIVEECIAHTYFGLFSSFDVNVILKLLEPHPVINILCLNNWIFSKLLNDIDIMYDV